MQDSTAEITERPKAPGDTSKAASENNQGTTLAETLKTMTDTNPTDQLSQLANGELESHSAEPYIKLLGRYKDKDLPVPVDYMKRQDGERESEIELVGPRHNKLDEHLNRIIDEIDTDPADVYFVEVYPKSLPDIYKCPDAETAFTQFGENGRVAWIAHSKGKDVQSWDTDLVTRFEDGYKKLGDDGLKPLLASFLGGGLLHVMEYPGSRADTLDMAMKSVGIYDEVNNFFEPRGIEITPETIKDAIESYAHQDIDTMTRYDVIKLFEPYGNGPVNKANAASNESRDDNAMQKIYDAKQEGAKKIVVVAGKDHTKLWQAPLAAMYPEEKRIDQNKLAVAEGLIVSTTNPIMAERLKNHQEPGKINQLDYEEITFVPVRHAKERSLDDPDIEATLGAFNTYSKKDLPPGQKKLVVVEGFMDSLPTFTDINQAVEQGEMGALIFRAQEAGIEVKSLEISFDHAYDEISAENPDITSEDFTFYHVLLGLERAVTEDGSFDTNQLGGLIYLLDQSLGRNMVESLSQDELAEVRRTHVLPIDKRNEVFDAYVPLFNDLMKEYTDEDLFTNRETINMHGRDPKEWQHFIRGLTIPSAPGPNKHLKKIGSEYNDARNTYILKETDELVEQGFHPIEFYGSDHADALEDAFNHVYTPIT